MKIKVFSCLLAIVIGMSTLIAFPVSGHEEEGLIVSSPVFVDLNNDGFKDIIGISNSARVSVYINEANGNFEKTSQNLGTSDVFCFKVTKISDLSGYFILIGENGKINIYENDGTGLFFIQTEITTSFTTTFIEAGDIDNDADFDLAFAFNEGVVIYRNEGSLSFSETTNILSISNPTNLLFNDIDSDSDLDLIVGQNNSNTNIFLNDGLGIFNW
ncbi:MAG: hypothetical protein A2161_01650 [Candidatus Schekmanbacteria bacterium RBG_13_48_7]|uniref:VCBS repeat-containing protein n=1 Tax=Candidatus Schekmanbacteria bacterium RBG_13_48_7 TaxID=1817878 RepID=A0A1F7RP42_9BACT|nr:MAG: hypothetical protein A2161_01650 [Candidatus Schekmanbacteria bacterium RBG_13_48_7]